MKTGYKTTEFWLSLAAMVVGALMASGVMGEDDMAMKVVSLVASMLGALGYTVSRGIAKKGEAIKEAVIASTKTSDP